MQAYPALKAHMGDWTYYIVKMRMREVAAEVKFGSQVHNDYALDQAIQRTIKESRVKKEIVTYLRGRRDRFFASLVVAAVGGSPKFFPVSVADDPQFEFFADEPSIEQSFGVLRFSGEQNYYALDGQHRLKAIKTFLQPDDESERVEAPPGFENEEISVLMVIRPPKEDENTWLASYRRLFSSLNRYAKPTDRDTNIIMDEDDVFAILTRRLVATHDFFKAPGKHLDSVRVQTKGRPLREGASHFTSLQQLYDMNETLLTTPFRSNQGWGLGPEAELVDNVNHFKRFRPPEEYIDELALELEMYWDAIIDVLSDLTAVAPSEAKNHQADGSDGKVADNVLFWPIGQEVMISVARALLDRRLPSVDRPTLEQAKMALRPLNTIDWRLHQTPWRGLLLVYEADNKRWSMRSDDRRRATDTAKQVLRWMTGIHQADEREEENLRKNWQARLGHLPDSDNPDELWREVKNRRSDVPT